MEECVMASKHKVQVTLSNEILALLQVEQDRTADSYSTCVRRAIRSHYADHGKSSAYADHYDRLSREYPARGDE
jgi:hypothetical protein